jgi:hypothetical protein
MKKAKSLGLGLGFQDRYLYLDTSDKTRSMLTIFGVTGVN